MRSHLRRENARLRQRTRTLDEMRGGAWPIWKHSGGKYQYVPAPCDVSSKPSEPVDSSITLDSPKSVIFTRPAPSNNTLPGFKS